MQPSIMATWVCLLALMLTRQPCHGDSVLTFTATPKAIKQNLTRHVTLRCEAAVNQARSGSTDEDIERVASYWVTYGDDEYVASVDTNEKAKGFIDEGNLRVSGSMSGMGYLALTWVSPSTMRLGTYKCHVNAKSKTNRFVQLKKSLQLTSEEPSVTDLLERINQNEQDRKEADKKQNSQHNKCSTPVAFQAHKASPWSIGSGVTVQFPRIGTNLGNSFNSTSGVFTSPKAGVYFFTCSAYTDANSENVRLRMMKNNVAVASLRAGVSQSDYDTATMSVVRHMDEGDTMRVVTYGASRFGSQDGKDNTFIGLLLYQDGC